MTQTVYLNKHKAIIHEDAGFGSRPNAWIVNVASDGKVTFPEPDSRGAERLCDLIDELRVSQTDLQLVIA